MNRPIVCPTLVGRKKGWNFDGYCYCDNVECCLTCPKGGFTNHPKCGIFRNTTWTVCKACPYYYELK